MKKNRNIIFIKKNLVKISYVTHGPPIVISTSAWCEVRRSVFSSFIREKGTKNRNIYDIDNFPSV